MDKPQTEREWCYFVTRHGIAGTAQILMQMDREIQELRQLAEEAKQMLRDAQDAQRLILLETENKRLKELLATGGSVVCVPHYPSPQKDLL